ncbi:hypothetical protein ACHAPO_010088 [Fusarium lateritium]
MDDEKILCEFEKIRQTIEDVRSVRAHQLQWLSTHIFMMESLDDFELEILCQIRAQMIGIAGGDPLDVAQGTPYTALDELFMKCKEYRFAAAGVRALAREMRRAEEQHRELSNPRPRETNREPDTETFGSALKDVTGTDTGPHKSASVGLEERNPLSYKPPYPMDNLMSHHTMQAITNRNSRRLELAKEMGKTIEDLRRDPDELAITWDGLNLE